MSSFPGRKNAGISSSDPDTAINNYLQHHFQGPPSRSSLLPTTTPMPVGERRGSERPTVSGGPESSPTGEESSNPNNNNNVTKIKKSTKTCKKCKEPISGQFVRALHAAYHIECFACTDCREPCSAKFFAVEAEDGSGEMIPLCERDYFQRLDLICHACKNALRGSYITALGHKYHIEHFTCSMCSTAFGPDDSYYEHNNSIYCHFHYSTLYASRCEGCQNSILKQFVEIYRGGVEQQWHPECYMIFKFWNVKLCPVGYRPTVNPDRPLSVDDSGSFENLTREQVEAYERKIEGKVLQVWTVLCGYEEVTAACISDMLQTASSGRFNDSLLVAAKLVIQIEVLYFALEELNVNLDPILALQKDDEENPVFTKLGKEPKTLCKKVVGFMSLVSKAREGNVKKMGITQDLLNLVTSLAHYLKVLIRYGLANALQYDRQYGKDTLTKFLTSMEKYRSVGGNDALENLGVNAMISDHCLECDQSVEDKCIKLGERFWHIRCISCARCRRYLGTELGDLRWDKVEKKVKCAECIAASSCDMKAKFIYVCRLQQYAHLLKIAVARLQLVLRTLDARDLRANGSASNDPTHPVMSTPNLPQYPSTSSATSEASPTSEKGYMTTLTDIRRLRSAKLDKQVSESARKARRSRVLDVPDSEAGQVKNESSTSLEPLNSPKEGGPADRKRQQLKVEEIIQEQTSTVSRLDRTTDLIKDEKSLTLDDIPRIVAAEQAREQRPNAFRHQARAISANIPAAHIVSDHNAPRKQYVSELSVEELFIARHVAVLLMHSLAGDLFTLDELWEIAEVKKPSSSLWGKFGKAFGGDKKSKKKLTGVFGSSLELLAEKYGVESTLGVASQPLRIPAFVDDCISSMRQKDMSVEGVFRKNGNIRRLKEFSELIDKNPDKTGILSEENAVQLAALLKKFLRELPEPLMTFKLQKLWISAQKLDDLEQRKRLLHYATLLLPKTHRDVMEVLFYFLSWTASFSHIDEESGSKMDAHNLATVITPNILYIKQKDGAATDSGDAYFLSIESVNTLIEEQNRFAEMPLDVLAAVRYIMNSTRGSQGSSEFTTKDIIAKFEQYLKEGGDAYLEGAATPELGNPAQKSAIPRQFPLKVNHSVDELEMEHRRAETSIKRVVSGASSGPMSP